MSEGGLRGFLQSIRRLFSGQRPPPGPAPDRVRTSVTAAPGPGAGPNLPASWQT